METLFSLSRFAYDAAPELPTLLLLLLLGLAWYIVRQASVEGGYWASIFHDENSKLSTLRVACLVAVAVSSAVLLYITINYVKSSPDLDGLLWFFGLYMAVWSGAPVASKALDAIIAKIAK